MKALGLLVWMFFLTALAVAGELPSIPATPSAVTDLVFARSFTLEKAFRYDWSKNHPLVNSGTLVVLKVDPALVYPRNSAEPILYAGNQTAQRLNQGHESGFVVAIIPGEIDLAKEPIWFGRPGLPEKVSDDTIRSERALADKAQIRPFPAGKIKNITQKPLRAYDLHALLREDIANLVLKYSPQEKDLAETWRLPVARALPKSK